MHVRAIFPFYIQYNNIQYNLQYNPPPSLPSPSEMVGFYDMTSAVRFPRLAEAVGVARGGLVQALDLVRSLAPKVRDGRDIISCIYTKIHI